jgi:hypothetical protein
MGADLPLPTLPSRVVDGPKAPAQDLADGRQRSAQPSSSGGRIGGVARASVQTGYLMVDGVLLADRP